MASHIAYDRVIGDRRRSVERRQYSYTAHIPERRLLPDRRCAKKLGGLEPRPAVRTLFGGRQAPDFFFLPVASVGA